MEPHSRALPLSCAVIAAGRSPITAETSRGILADMAANIPRRSLPILLLSLLLTARLSLAGQAQAETPPASAPAIQGHAEAQVETVPSQSHAETPVYPALAGLNEFVSLDALDATVGQAAAFLSDQTPYVIAADPRYRDLRVSLAGAAGTLGDVLSGLCLAANVEPRRLDRWIILSPAARGIAVVARQLRAQYAPRLADDSAQLVAWRAAAARQALQLLGLGTRAQALSELNDFQLAALRAQGYLTVAQLFPDYYLPLYDVFGYVTDGRAQRPPSLPEFAGTRVYLNPALRLELHIPRPAGGAEAVWPIDVIPAGGR